MLLSCSRKFTLATALCYALAGCAVRPVAEPSKLGPTQQRNVSAALRTLEDWVETDVLIKLDNSQLGAHFRSSLMAMTPSKQFRINTVDVTFRQQIIELQIGA